MENMKNAIKNTISVTDLARNVSKVMESIKDGPKVIIKNNKPEAVLMSTEDYLEMLENIEDMQDALLANKRIKVNKGKKTIDSDTFWKDFDVDEAEVDDSEVEFE